MTDLTAISDFVVSVGTEGVVRERDASPARLPA